MSTKSESFGLTTYTRTSNGVLVFYTLPTFVAHLALLLTLGFMGLVLSLMIGVRVENMRFHPNPLAAYESIWPGQTIQNVAIYVRQASGSPVSCSAWTTHQEYPGLNVHVSGWETASYGQNIFCANYPADGVFSMMALSIRGDKVVGLNLVSKVLPEDVLLLYWGIPDKVRDGGNGLLFLIWQRSGYLATAMVRQSDSVVEHVILTAQ